MWTSTKPLAILAFPTLEATPQRMRNWHHNGSRRGSGRKSMAGKRHEQSSLKSLKRKNRHDVLELLRNAAGPLSILDISRQTALSKMTVHKILGLLVDKGLVTTVGKGEPGEDGGKRPTMFAFNAGYRFIFALKIAETFLVAAATDLKARILATERVSFDRETSLSEILRLIRNLLGTLAKKADFRHEECAGIVVGCHGITDSESGVIVTSPHFSSWGSNIPIRNRIEELFPFQIPVHIDNWIRYSAYGELKTGERVGDSFMVVGTEIEGIAAGLVMEGMLISGTSGLSGEIGHMIVEPRSPEICVCGGIGCLEVMVSLRRMLGRAWASRGDWPDSQVFRGGTKTPTPETIFAAANAGDVFACTLLDEVIGYFAVGINNIAQVCDPGLILIQGEYAKAGRYFIEQLNERLKRLSLLRMDKGTRVEYTDKDDEWTLAGAAHYVSDAYFADFAANGSFADE